MSAVRQYTSPFVPHKAKSLLDNQTIDQTIVTQKVPGDGIRVAPLQSTEQQVAQCAERALLGLWLADSASCTEAGVLAQNIFERAQSGARALGYRLVLKDTQDGKRFVPEPVSPDVQVKSNSEFAR